MDSSEDILVFVDGDDWLIDDNVLERLNRFYNENGVWMTYGGMYCYPDGAPGNPQNTEYSDNIHTQNLYRKDLWRASHLRSFKWHLYKRINKADKDNIRVIIEKVSAMPGQGVTSMFNFGQSFGILKGICSAMQLSMFFVRPAKWKKYFGLINSEKDASRTRAIEIFPYFSSELSKKKDSNKADAILIASFYYETYKLAE